MFLTIDVDVENESMAELQNGVSTSNTGMIEQTHLSPLGRDEGASL